MLVTLLLERDAVGATGNPEASADVFEIERIEQIKGIPKGPGQKGNLGFFERLRIPVIENTAKEEDLTEALEKAIEVWPNTYAVLVRRHGIYVFGDDVAQAKTICESLDWIFKRAVEMKGLGLPWIPSS